LISSIKGKFEKNEKNSLKNKISLFKVRKRILKPQKSATNFVAQNHPKPKSPVVYVAQGKKIKKTKKKVLQ